MYAFSTAIRITCPNAKMASLLAHLLTLEGAPAAWLFGLDDGLPYVAGIWAGYLFRRSQRSTTRLASNDGTMRGSDPHVGYGSIHN